MSIDRKKTRKIKVGDLCIGGDAPVTVQSMTISPTENLATLLPEIERLESAGCQIIRVTIPNINAAKKIPVIKKHATVPLVADIHFNHKLALIAIDAGIDKVRINPGNIGDSEKVRQVLQKAKIAGVPIRIGVNSGSLEKDLLKKYGHPTPAAMLESAERHIKICRDNDFHDIAVSLKSSDTYLMIAANRLFAEKYDYPLHLGVTEAGPVRQGTIKSAIGIGTLLAEGIGDTIRVSLTGDPVEEVRVGYAILKSLNLINTGVNIVSCPTCGRTQTNVAKIAEEIEKETGQMKKKATIAVMGCVVNGPGEAREADIGVACGKNNGVIFKKGEVIDKVPEAEILPRLLKELAEL
ncbi:MAG: flavodoxin-dependent (E)-4-hydroxy-3-methylbut-2-enyl-diphosphate synthase [Fidelibacterota bacterium]